MKKSHYLHYLNQYQSKLPVQVEKTFKNIKKGIKQNGLKASKPKITICKTSNHPHIPGILKKSQNKQNRQTKQNKQSKQNKQNIHPNVIIDNKKQIRNLQNIKRSHLNNLKRQQQNIKDKQISKQILKINKQPLRRGLDLKDKLNNIKQLINEGKEAIQFSLSLNRCNFEQSHQSENLYLVQTQNNRQLIVCQKCSKRFSNRTKISQLNNTLSNTNKPLLNSKLSYKNLVMGQQQLKEHNKKLVRLQLIQQQQTQQALNKLQTYYNYLIKVILQSKQQLQTYVMSIYNKNNQMLNQKIQNNRAQIDMLNHIIQIYQKSCRHDNQEGINRQTMAKNYQLAGINHQSTNIDSNNVLTQSQIQSIANLLQFIKTQNKLIQLQSIQFHIPIELLAHFQSYFKSSPFYLHLQTPSSHSSSSSSTHQPSQQSQFHQLNQPIQQIPQEYQPDTSQNKLYKDGNTIAFSVDFQKQIPFNVQYSATSLKSNNFSHKIHDQLLSKISSSQQLLLESLRNHQQPLLKIQKQIHSQPIDQYINDKLAMNFKTQASTYRAQQPSKQQVSHKKNFIKQLHIQQNDLDDLICDQDLNLSSSHPIYQAQELTMKPIKSLRLLNNPIKKRQTPSLPLSQLTNNSSKVHRNSESIQLLNKQPISTNENKHQISFEMDQNIIIDANILPSQQTQQQNLDIISPAFKII